MENNLDHKIINLYENSNFFKIYGFDFWITIISIILCILLISFIFITNNFNEIRQNWDKERCNPAYLPFAGFINPQPNQTNLEYTAENFKFCNDKFIKKAEEKALSPLYHLSEYLNNIINTIIDTWKSILGSLNLLKDKLMELVQLVINKLIAVLIPVQFMFIKVKDSISKMTGTLVGSIYTFYNLYKVIKLYFLNLIQIIVTEILVGTIITLLASIGVLIALLITWAALNAASLIWPPFTLPLAAVATALWIGVIVPLMITIGIILVFDIIVWTCLVLLNNFANEIYKDVNTPQVPRQPTKISSSDIKTTSDKSTNPLKGNQ
uniref:Transmembrane protein n=1 Tax=Nucleocytoviricota sp. TaxID=2809609 RepID=A0A9E8G4L1_9VIRU|nr:hypothetical protein [Nucleocytoviricota sp.]UZT29284.1 hypothetical protein [Nucleocytoviricota sp.]